MLPLKQYQRFQNNMHSIATYVHHTPTPPPLKFVHSTDIVSMVPLPCTARAYTRVHAVVQTTNNAASKQFGVSHMGCFIGFMLPG